MVSHLAVLAGHGDPVTDLEWAIEKDGDTGQHRGGQVFEGKAHGHGNDAAQSQDGLLLQGDDRAHHDGNGDDVDDEAQNGIELAGPAGGAR